MSVTSDLKAFCKSQGADLVGIADLEQLKNNLPTVPEDLLAPYSFAVSVGVRLPDDIINEIFDRPTGAYADLCRKMNDTLNSLSSVVVKWIQDRGHSAAAIPASMKVDDKNLLGNVSHKAIARTAGMGWQGKSLLIVTPEFGPRIRLTSVLTDMPLEADHPVRNRCGSCTQCFEACPSSAIKNVSTRDHYKDRDEAIHLSKCHAKLLEFSKRPEIGYTFCGVCISVCPFGKKSSRIRRQTER